MHVKCDILIVGSGAGGGTLAATLSELTDKHIVLIEKGPYCPAQFFNQRELDMMVLLADRGARSTSDGSMSVVGGECVGGGTTVNYALSFDPIESVWDRWRREYGLTGFSFEASTNDYGITDLNFSRCTNEVNARCNIHEPEDAEINENNRLFLEGCKKSGVSAKKFRLNMRGCIGCGFCGQGCAYDAKQGTMVTYVQDALHRGVQLIHHCSIETLEFQRFGERLRVVGARGTVVPTLPGSRPNTALPGPITLEAGLIIVSAGSIETPALLQRSNHPDPHDRIGRGLIAHPSLPVVGMFDRTIDGYRGITGSYYSDHFYAEHGFMLECLYDHPIDGAVALPGLGDEHFNLMLQYARLAAFGVMLIDTPTDENRVIWDHAQRKSMISYRMSNADMSRMRFGAEKAVQIMFASGAREVLLTSDEPINASRGARFSDISEAALCSKLNFIPNQTLLSSAHAQATVKMSEHPHLGMLNSRGESHMVHGLIVCDSSAFPTSCGANPMISIMTMARYQGKRIAGEHRRYDL